MLIIFQDKNFLYDFLEDKWTELAPMQETHHKHGCGLAIREDGTKEVVVAGGYRKGSVEIFNLDSQSWR